MCRFYQTSTKYLSGHLPRHNKHLSDLHSLHPRMHTEDQTSHVIRKTAKKERLKFTTRQKYPLSIFLQDDVGQLIDEWKMSQWQKIPEDPIGTPVDATRMAPPSTEELTTTGGVYLKRQAQLVHHALVSHRRL